MRVLSGMLVALGLGCSEAFCPQPLSSSALQLRSPTSSLCTGTVGASAKQPFSPLAPQPLSSSALKMGLFDFGKKSEDDATEDDKKKKEEFAKWQEEQKNKKTIGGGASPWNTKAEKGAKSSFFARNANKDKK
mmetsp:Transcript_17203/g.26613  ORF Transcript_17203/g.26613 Transcript_17203/m.26613 type:complete len:133 (+) Transcript_17203:55-453(+)